MMEGFTMMKSIDEERDRFEDEPIARTKIVCPYCGEKLTLFRDCPGSNSPDKYFTMCESGKCKARFYQIEGVKEVSWTLGRWSFIFSRKYVLHRYLTEEEFLERLRDNIETQRKQIIFPKFWDSQNDALLFLDKNRREMMK